MATPSFLTATVNFVGLSIVSCISFWCQSVVTEERLVPALNVIADYFNIPDDIAGATLMAAGASSPELLCTIVSLFITHSSLGLGTIVGSEIFNQLIICAGSVYASKTHHHHHHHRHENHPHNHLHENVANQATQPNQTKVANHGTPNSTNDPYAKYGTKYLVLDKVMVIREVGFYGLSILLLYISLSESRWVEAEAGEPNEGGDGQGDGGRERQLQGDGGADHGEGAEGGEYIFVTFWKACLLFGGYVLYVIVCSNMETCLKCFRWMGCMERGGSNLEGGEQHTLDDGFKQVEHSNNASNANNGLGESELSTNYALDSTGHGSVHFKSFDDHDIHRLPFIYNISTEPVENWEVDSSSSFASGEQQDRHREHHRVHNDPIVICHSSASDASGASGASQMHEDVNNEHNDNDDNNDHNDIDDEHRKQHKALEKKKRNILSKALHKSFSLIGAGHLLHRTKYPIEINDVYELTNSEGEHELRCFLWQRSIFYTHAYFGSHAFHLRWFTITPHKISSVPDRDRRDQDPKDSERCMVYPLFDEIYVDEKRLIIFIKHPVENKRDFTLMAPNVAIFHAVVNALTVYMSSNRDLRLAGITEVREEDSEVDIMKEGKKKKHDVDADPHVELIEFPTSASRLEKVVWLLVFPLRYAMHYTLPDVRHLDRHGDPTTSVGYAYLSTIMCLIWLILGSYIMVTSLEALAALMNVPDSIVGLTVSAAGTSLPAYVASRVAAENGFGNQAVANVFGSNTFNICIGLGLPWVMYIVEEGFEPYHDLENEGIVESILIMGGVLLIFVGLMMSTNFVLLKWHADLFIGLYVAFIVYAIWQVFV